MGLIINLLLETVVVSVLDPLVFGGAAVASLALCSGLVAYAKETFESRLLGGGPDLGRRSAGAGARGGDLGLNSNHIDALRVSPAG